MKKTMLALTAAASMAFGGISLAASPAIEQAKAQCVIGEQADGYLGVVEGQRVNEELRREIRENNQQRKAIYADFASRNGLTIETAAAIFAERQVNAAPPGQCVRDPNGAWLRKP
jgi:uncharacterized protein YdbL (DUF1318 family)